MKTWVITGGIACGKSRLAKLLRANQSEIALFNSDQVVHELLETGEVKEELSELLGDNILSSDGAIDKSKLRLMLLNTIGAKKILEKTLHPRVYKQLEKDIKKLRDENEIELLIAEVPLYYESNGDLATELSVVVATSELIQLKRLTEDRGLDAQIAKGLIEVQMPLKEKIKLADKVVWNEGSEEALQIQAKILLQQIPRSMQSEEHTETDHQVKLETNTTPDATADLAVIEAKNDQASVVEVPPVEASEPQTNEPKVLPPFPEEVSINELQLSSLGALQTLSTTLGWRFNGSRSKHQLIVDLLSWMLQHGTKVYVEGLLEIQQENFGLIRYPKYNFSPLPEDVFVPIFVIRKFNLRPGHLVKASIKVPREKEKYLAMDRILEVEGQNLEQWQPAPDFDKLTATFPSQRIMLENPKASPVSSRVVDIVAPLGKGQRALICASPRSGKTMLLKDIARSITTNHPEIHLIVLLLDERPEEVTDFEESVSTEIYSSTFDESPKRHTQVAEIVLERAKRLVESGKDVVILLDSITRLARGYNAMMGGKGRTMSGGIDAKALMKPKKFFGAARKVEEGGSLTIVATALVETESRMDEVIFEEFKGTGNMEVNLDREIAERRIYPAIHVLKSGTRRDELLYHPDEFKRISVIRKQLASVPAYEAIEFLLKNIERSKCNAELLITGLR